MEQLTSQNLFYGAEADSSSSSIRDLCISSNSTGSPWSEEEVLLAAASDDTTASDEGHEARPPSLNVFRYVFIAAQLLHGAGAAAILTLGPTLLDETLDKTRAPLYIGIFESSFVLGPAIG